MRLPWLIRLAWDPADAFDWYDSRTPSRLDHGKVIPDLTLFAFLVMYFLRVPVPWYALVALPSVAFGQSVWRAFLKSRTMTGTFTETASKTQPNLWKDDERADA